MFTGILSFLCIFSSLAVILLPNPVHSVLYLVFAFCCGGILLIGFGAEFLGLIVLIVYVGAIAVLFLFVVMILNINVEARNEERKSLVLVGVGLVMLTFFGSV